MIKNIVFDMGMVLIYFRPAYYIERLGINGDEKDLLLKVIFNAPEWIELDWGHLKEEEALAIMCAKLPKHLHEAAKKLVMMWDRPILEVPGMCELIAELKHRGYGIYLLSNASLRQHDYWPRIPASKYFDGTIVSADVKSIKPHPEIYRALFDTYDLKPEECFFIDDRTANVEGGEKLGMRGFIFSDDVAALRKYMKEIGIL